MDGQEEDRLSALSDDLLLHILHLVPSKEAASTSVLSRRWGSLWRSSGAVNLLAVRIDDDIFACQEAFVRAAEAALAAADARVTRLTVRVEADRGGDQAIDLFLCCNRDTWRKDGDVLADLLSHRAARHVEELRVALADRFDACLGSDQETDRSGALHQIASLPAPETLRVLDLSRCGLALPAAVAFPRLATLRLRFISVEPKSFEALLNGAPELETVRLEYVLFNVPPAPSPHYDEDPDQPPAPHYDDEDPDQPAVPHYDEDPDQPPVFHLRLRNVSTLVMAWCGLDGPGSGPSPCKWAIDIDAPRLRSFVYKGHVRPLVLAPPPPDIARVDLHFLDNGPYKRSAYSNHDEGDERVRVLFWQFVQNFANARSLKLRVSSDLKDIAAIGKARRAKLLCVLPGVERLELEGVHRPASKTATVAIANLLQCCPLLRDFSLKLSTVRHDSEKSKEYGLPFLERKDRLDYNKSIDRFVRRSRVLANSKTTAISMEGSTGDVPGLSGRSFTCLQSSLRRVCLQFRGDDDKSSTNGLGERLIKFFASNAMVLEEMCVDSGNRRFYEHLNCKACFQHKDTPESSRKFTMLSPLQ